MQETNTCLDMLVALYNLPAKAESLTSAVHVRQVMALEKTQVITWVAQTFGKTWADEVAMSFSQHPIRCFIATKDKKIIGFAVYDATRPGFFGPIGIEKTSQNHGIGKALTLETLHHMQSQGYAYAIIGWVAPETQKYFKQIVQAYPIPGSNPLNSSYKGILVSH